jgi:hypothetical protein
MSEFAHSLHFLGTDASEVDTLMRDAHARGAILGSNGRTVSVLVGWEHKPQLCSRGNVIDYAYGEDHGIWIRFYNDGQMVAKVVIVWDTQGFGEEDEYNSAGITDDLAAVLVDNGFLAVDEARDLAACLGTFQPEDWSGRDAFVDKVGGILGLCAFRWLKAEDLEDAYADEEYREAILEELREEYPDAILIE